MVIIMVRGVEMRLVLHCSRAAKLGGDIHMILIELRIRLKMFTLQVESKNSQNNVAQICHIISTQDNVSLGLGNQSSKSRPMSKP